MKFLILKNNINKELDETLLDKGLAEVSRLLKTIDFPHTFNIQKTSVNYTSVPYIGANPTEVAGGYQVNPVEVLKQEKVYGDHDVIALFYDPTNIQPKAPVNPTDNGEVIQLPSDWYGEDNPQNTEKEKINVFAQFFLHELCHERFWATNKKDITHDFYTSAYSQKQPIDYFLYLLKMLKPVSQKKKYKYFSEAEVERFKLVPELWELLDKAREISKTPYVISSGFRTPEQNKKAGGKANSSHLRGLAVDINCDNFNRGAILNGLLNCGTPLFIEDAVKHIHADLDATIHKIPQMMVEPNDN